MKRFLSGVTLTVAIAGIFSRRKRKLRHQLPHRNGPGRSRLMSAPISSPRLAFIS